MKPVRTVYNKSWIPYKCRVDFYLSSSPVDFSAPVTTVHGFFWYKGRLLLVKHRYRGWEVPGGHIESNESFEFAMKRELYEEAQMTCSRLDWLGYLEKTAMEDAPENCRYPHPLSYCVFFRGLVEDIEIFTGDTSIVQADFFSPEQAGEIPWVQAYKEYFEASMNY